MGLPVDQSGNAWALSSGAVPTASPFGMGVRGPSGVARNTTVILPTAAATVLWAGVGVASGNNVLFGEIPGVSANRLVVLGLGGVFYFDFGGISAGSTRLTYTIPSSWWGQPHLLAAAAGPGGMQLWIDGVLVASHSTATSRTNSSSPGFDVGQYQSGTYVHNAPIAGCWVCNRQLTETEIRQWTAAPWSMYQQPEYPAWFGLAGAGGPVTATAGVAVCEVSATSATVAVGPVTATAGVAVCEVSATSATVAVAGAGGEGPTILLASLATDEWAGASLATDEWAGASLDSDPNV
jgi:hypothetical protein